MISVVALSVVATSALGGFAFWLLVSRRVPDDTMGEATALASSALFVAFVCNLGIPLAVGRHASTSARPDVALFGLATAVSASAGLLGAFIYAVVAPTTFGAILDSSWPWAALAFVFIAGLAPLVQLIDVRLLALGRFRIVLLRPLVALLAKLTGVVVVTGRVEGDGLPVAIFCALLLPEALIGFVGAIVLGGRALTGVVRSRRAPAWRPAARAAGFNYVSLLLVQGTMMGVPVVVLAFVDASTNANFYLAWSFALIALVMTQAVMWGLHIEGETDGARLRHQTGRAIRVSVVLGAALTAGSLLLVPALPLLYGADFREAGRLAPLAVATCIPYAVTVMLLTEARVRESAPDIIRVAVTFATSVAVPVLVATPRFGAAGAVVSVIGGATAAALLSSAVWLRSSPPERVVTPPPLEHA